MKRLGAMTLLLLLTLYAASDAAELPEPTVRNAQLRSLGATGDLAAAFDRLVRRIDGPAWVGYPVPLVAGQHSIGCAEGAVLSLEGSGSIHLHSHEDQPAEDTLLVWLRIHGGEVGRIQPATPNCVIDAGGLPLYWFSEVDPRQSLDLLLARLGSARHQRVSSGALIAIAFHAEERADPILERVATGELVRGMEEEAVFLLGAQRGRRGFEALLRLGEEEPAKLREAITFGISASGQPEAVDVLIKMARHDPHPRVRGQAIFWLAQEVGDRISAVVSQASVEDPDIEVRKQAIFALSQLPADQGIPLLIRHARTHPHPEIRRQAVFWLGQSEDARALSFFEEVLTE